MIKQGHSIWGSMSYGVCPMGEYLGEYVLWSPIFRTAENSILLTQKRGGGTGWSFLPFPPQSSAFCCSFDLLAALEIFLTS